jgi:predicted nucleic acid-binding protein
VSVKVVADSSFLIALATIDALPLVSRIFSEVFIPDAVYDEVVTRGVGLPGAEEVARAAWIKRITVKDDAKLKAYLAERLGAGESEALALAEELNADVVLIDDERAWEVARRKGIACLRSLELVLEAHRRQLLDMELAKSQIMQLGQKRWISEEVLEAAVKRLTSR